MPNTGPMRPSEPIRVLVRGTEPGWTVEAGLMREWRWVDEGIGAWEGLVSINGSERWVPGSQLARIGVSDSVDPPIATR